MVIFVNNMAENNVGKEKRCRLPTIFPYPQCVQKPFVSRSLKLENVWYRVRYSL